MTDLWNEIGGEFTKLTLVISRVLANRDAELQVGQALNNDGIPWTEITRTFRSEPSFPKNIVRLSLASDCLRTMSNAILADGDVEDDEVYTAYSLSSPLAKVLASLARYATYENLDIDECLQFLQALYDDPNWYGGKSDYLLGLSLASYVGELKCDQTIIESYQRIIRRILTGVFGGEPRTVSECQLVEEYNELFSSLGSTTPTQSTTRSTRQVSNTSTGIGSQQALQDDDEWINQLMENAEANSTTADENEIIVPAEQSLAEAMAELESLIGLDGVKTEVNRLMSFLKIQQHRKEHGLKESGQTLHFVFTGNPGTGKTTVARIVSKVLHGFQLLKTTKVVECDRSDLVGGYLGQTAIKTDELIDSALDGVLFIDEAYALAGDYGYGDMYGDEAINTMLKRMEDDRDRLVVIVAGYPKPMKKFIQANPGLESRFTRYIDFEDYTVAELCRIFEKFCQDAEYNLSTDCRAVASVLFTIAYNQRDERFGNARFIRNVFERATSLHSERLASLPSEQISRDMLVTLDTGDISFESVKNVTPQDVDLANARWGAKCPGCGKQTNGTVKFLGQRVTCKKCNQAFVFPWWSVVPETVIGIPVDYLKTTESPCGVIEERPREHSEAAKQQAIGDELPPAYDHWTPDPEQGAALLKEALRLLKAHDCDAAVRNLNKAIQVDWPGSNPSDQPYYLVRAKAYQMNGDDRPVQALEDYNEAHRSRSMGHYKQSRDSYLSALDHDPSFMWASNNLAWVLATCDSSSIRNGSEAVKHGLYACRNSNWHCWSFIGTLAASYAEAGQFDEAVTCSERALMMVPPKEKAVEEEMLSRFRSGRPYRDD